MMYLDTPPRPIGTEVFSAMPDHYRRKGVRTDWADANRPGQPTDCFIEGPSFDADGNLYVVDIPFGRIFRIAPDGQWSLVTEYDGWPNGLKISADGRILVADYMHGIMELDAQAGRMTPVLTARLPDRHRRQPQRPGARPHRERAVCRDDPRQRGLARAFHEGRQCFKSRPLLFDLRSERSRWPDDGRGRPAVRGARLARACVRVRAQWRVDRAHQVLRWTELHQCRDRRQEPRPPLCDGISDGHRTGRGYQRSQFVIASSVRNRLSHVRLSLVRRTPEPGHATLPARSAERRR